MNFASVFVLIGDILIFGQLFTAFEFIGMFIILISGVVISYNYKQLGKININFVFWIMISSGLFFAIRSLLVEYSITSLNGEPIQIYAWSIIGTVFVAIITLLTKSNRNKCINVFTNQRKIIKYTILTKNLGGVAKIFYIFGVEREAVSIISYVTTSQPIFVFIFAYISYKLIGVEELKEKLDGISILQKIVSISLMLLGMYLISMF